MQLKAGAPNCMFNYSGMFAGIINTFSDIIIGQLYGHTHEGVVSLFPSLFPFSLLPFSLLPLLSSSPSLFFPFSLSLLFPFSLPLLSSPSTSISIYTALIIYFTNECGTFIDSFLVFRDDTAYRNPTSFGLVTPSLTPYVGHNPAARLIAYDNKTKVTIYFFLSFMCYVLYLSYLFISFF
jgi:hypothetical protein